MTLVSTLLRDAYRESNLIAVSADPTTAEQGEALRLLNRYVLSVYGNEAGEGFGSLPVGGNNVNTPSGFPFNNLTTTDFIPLNSRLVLNLKEDTTVHLSPIPQDGSRFAYIDVSNNLAVNSLVIDGNGRNIEGSSVVTKSVDGDAAEYVYRSDTGNWAKVSPLITTDAFPFPSEFDDLFVIGLALRLNPRYGIAADPQSIEMFKRVLRNFKARYRQTKNMRSELGLLFIGDRNRFLRYGSSDSLFNSGYGFPNWLEA